LRDFICSTYGLIDPVSQQRSLNLVLLEGHSMGGAIVTHIAERELSSTVQRYNGIIAVGAALLVQEMDDNQQILRFSHKPRIPMIYLTNSDETHIIEEYISKAKEQLANSPEIIVPSLWVVFRNGHDNVNDLERIKAFDGLMNWITTGTCEEYNDVTSIIQPTNNVVYFDDEGVWGRGIFI
jgi:pimeloyl-ACP methyl ester carboxylesterase